MFTTCLQIHTKKFWFRPFTLVILKIKHNQSHLCIVAIIFPLKKCASFHLNKLISQNLYRSTNVCYGNEKQILKMRFPYFCSMQFWPSCCFFQLEDAEYWNRSLKNPYHHKYASFNGKLVFTIYFFFLCLHVFCHHAV